MLRSTLALALLGCGGGPEETGACTWTAGVFDFDATVVNGQTGEAVEGAVVTCEEETEPVAVSDSAGAISIQLDLMWGGSCGWSRCQTMTIDASDQGLEPVTVDAIEDQGAEVVLQYLPD